MVVAVAAAAVAAATVMIVIFKSRNIIIEFIRCLKMAAVTTWLLNDTWLTLLAVRSSKV